MGQRRLAIYGGTFDPVHNGHLEVARRVQKLFEMDELILVPACTPPHKRSASITSGFHRFAMLALATQSDEKFRISTIELDQPESPYAIDTVSRLRTEFGSNHRLFFLIGADSWEEITTWREWQRLLRMCDLIVVTRPGYDLVERAPIEGVCIVDVRGQKQVSLRENQRPGIFLSDAANVDVSATAIRAAARANNSEALRVMMPAVVVDYIVKQKLYRN